MQYHHCKQPSDILRVLNHQRRDTTFCDVIVRTDNCTSSIYAHQCVLAASSDYFATLFRHNLNNDVKVIETVIAVSSFDVGASVIDFLYTGDINISEENVEEMVQLVDYLGIQTILDFCGSFMNQSLNYCNCLKFKALSDHYPLVNMADSVKNYILPRMSTVVQSVNATEAPLEIFRQVLNDKELNYPKESDLLKLIQSLIEYHRDFDPSENERARGLLEFIDFDYLSPEVIRQAVLSHTDTLEWLSSRPQLLSKVRSRGTASEVQSSPRENTVEGIICRGKARGKGEDLQLLLYLVRDDSWRILRQTVDQNGVGIWNGLETLTVLDCCLYTLSSSTEDMNGYMHQSKETKVFGALNVRTGAWDRLPSPATVAGNTMLVSMRDSLVAVDRTGKVERYLARKRQWVEWCGDCFPELQSTICLLPMPKGEDLYLLRSCSSGFSFSNSQRSFSLYYLGAGLNSWAKISEIEAPDLFYDCDQVNLFDYRFSPGLVSLNDELGHTRAEFSTESSEWSTVSQKVKRPSFIRDIYGSAECGQRVYFVARSAMSNENVFAMYDHSKSRFKMVQCAPTDVSGLLYHVTLESSYAANITSE